MGKSVILGNSLPGLKNITFHPPAFTLRQLTHFWWYARTKNLPGDLEAEVPLSLENLPTTPDNLFERDPFLEHIEQCLKKNVYLTLDVCYLGVSKKDILQALEIIPQQLLITNVHFSDARGFQEHLWPGQGELPLADFVRALKEKSYCNLLTLEVAPTSLPQEKKRIVARLKEFLVWIKSLFSDSKE